MVSVDVDGNETIKVQKLDENGNLILPGGGFETNTIVTKYKKAAGKTIHSLDLYSYNHLGGSWNFDLKIMRAGDKSDSIWKDGEATDGMAVPLPTSATSMALTAGLPPP